MKLLCLKACMEYGFVLLPSSIPKAAELRILKKSDYRPRLKDCKDSSLSSLHPESGPDSLGIWNKRKTKIFITDWAIVLISQLGDQSGETLYCSIPSLTLFSPGNQHFLQFVLERVFVWLLIDLWEIYLIKLLYIGLRLVILFIVCTKGKII